MDRAARPLLVAAAGIATIGGYFLYHSLTTKKPSSSSPSSTTGGLSPSSSTLISRAGRPPIAGGAIIVVDPLSTGAMLAQYIINRGIPCIRVYSRTFPDDVANWYGCTLSPHARCTFSSYMYACISSFCLVYLKEWISHQPH
jgi:hypothetical protein